MQDLAHKPPALSQTESFLPLTAVKCAQCKTTIAYANEKSPTRTIKFVCSMGCGADYFRTPHVQVREP